jgi:CheY-like chemotaxis protein
VVRILIADNDDFLLDTLQSFLWDRGHEAEIAADALECVTVLHEFVPDVLVLADELPWGGADGVMACMQDDPTLSRTAVVLLASNGAPESSAASSRSVLRKPFRLGELLFKLESLAETTRSNRGGTPCHPQAVSELSTNQPTNPPGTVPMLRSPWSPRGRSPSGKGFFRWP